MKHTINVRWLVNWNCARSRLSHTSQGFMKSYSLSKWRFCCSLGGHIHPPPFIMWIFKLRMVSTFWAHNPIIFLRGVFLVFVLRSTPNDTYHSNIGVPWSTILIIIVLHLGMTTLGFNYNEYHHQRDFLIINITQIQRKLTSSWFCFFLTIECSLKSLQNSCFVECFPPILTSNECFWNVQVVLESLILVEQNGNIDLAKRQLHKNELIKNLKVAF